MFSALRRTGLQISFVSAFCMTVLTSPFGSASIKVDDFNTGAITNCTNTIFGKIPTFNNLYHLVAPNTYYDGFQYKGKCNQNLFYGYGGEHEYTHTAGDNVGSTISFIRNSGLSYPPLLSPGQAMALNLVGDSSIMNFVYDGKDHNHSTNSYGLNNLDLTSENVVRLRLQSSTNEATVKVTLYNDDTNYSEITQTIIPANHNNLEYIDLLLQDFIETGTVDLSDVKAVALELNKNPKLIGSSPPTTQFQTLCGFSWHLTVRMDYNGLSIDNFEFGKTARHYNDCKSSQ